jgi:hypothetical protein
MPLIYARVAGADCARAVQPMHNEFAQTAPELCSARTTLHFARHTILRTPRNRLAPGRAGDGTSLALGSINERRCSAGQQPLKQGGTRVKIKSKVKAGLTNNDGIRCYSNPCTPPILGNPPS